MVTYFQRTTKTILVQMNKQPSKLTITNPERLCDLFSIYNLTEQPKVHTSSTKYVWTLSESDSFWEIEIGRKLEYPIYVSPNGQKPEGYSEFTLKHTYFEKGKTLTTTTTRSFFLNTLEDVVVFSDAINSYILAEKLR
jgi:hypothetical protein